jgi:hypothetical protein
MHRLAGAAALGALGLVAVGWGAACDAAGEKPGAPGSAGAAPETGGGGEGAGGGGHQGGDGSEGGGGGGSCADLVVEAEIEQRPVDIVFVIDNSASMGDEADAIEANINVNLAHVLETNQVDYRLIMVTDHGPGSLWDKELCIAPPLSGTLDCAGPPISVPGRFYHYDIHVESLDATCRLFDSLFGSVPDEWAQASSGWHDWLRPEALKVIIAITDDEMGCFSDDEAGALAFDHQLLQASPAQFGYFGSRNYVFYSLVGVAPKADPLEPYGPLDDLVTTSCWTAVGPGLGYQWLSKLTGGLRFPVCNHESYDAVFQDIAAGVTDITAIPCELAVPEAPPGELLDLGTLELLYSPGDGSATQLWTQVPSAAECGPASFYLDTAVTPPRIHLCPEACSLAAADPGAAIEIRVDCALVAR